MSNRADFSTGNWHRWRGKSTAAKVLLTYLYTCPHGHWSGLFTCPVAYICADLGMDEETIYEAFAEVDDLVGYDFDTGVVLLRDVALRLQQTTAKQAAGIVRHVSELPVCEPVDEWKELTRQHDFQFSQTPLKPHSNGVLRRGKGKGKGESKKEEELPDEFEQFYTRYPSPCRPKPGRPAAFKRWEQARSRNKLSHADLLATCLAALEWQEKLPEWQDANGKYIPGIEPWLNQDKFLADPPQAMATKPNRPPEYRAERPRPGGEQ